MASFNQSLLLINQSSTPVLHNPLILSSSSAALTAVAAAAATTGTSSASFAVPSALVAALAAAASLNETLTISSALTPLETEVINAAASDEPAVDVTTSYLNFQSIITAIILTIVIFGTVVGNILVCIAVCLVRKLRRPCNYLLVSLAVSDLCVAILVMPIALLYEILGNWSFGPVVCNLWVSFDVLSCTASILNLCMISVDRYYAITKPLEYGVKRTPKRMIFCVFLVWLGAACISLPPLLILGNEHEQITKDGVVPSCNVCQNFGYQIYATVGSFYIPLTVMMVVYYKIFRAARRIVLDEKKAQSHLEAHCYLEISVKNGGGPPENKIAAATACSQGSSPAANVTSRINQTQHRSSSASTNTTCSMDKTSIARCFTTRRSNESQCPMLSRIANTTQVLTSIQTTNGNGRDGTVGGGGIGDDDEAIVGMITPNIKDGAGMGANSRKHSHKTSAAANFLATLRSAGGSPNVSVAHTSQKKLRFQLAKERKASTTLGIIMSAFTFCWLPFFVLALVRPFLEDESAIPRSLSSLFLWLGYANSLLNPIIYATLNRDFRKPFQEILYFRCGSLNHMMREEFYHSQYGDPDQHTYCGHVNIHNTRGNGANTGATLDYDEAVEYIEADVDGTNVKTNMEITSSAHESFL